MAQGAGSHRHDRAGTAAGLTRIRHEPHYVSCDPCLKGIECAPRAKSDRLFNRCRVGHGQYLVISGRIAQDGFGLVDIGVVF